MCSPFLRFTDVCCISELINPRAPGRALKFLLLRTVLSSSSSSAFSHTQAVATFDLSPPEINMDNENLPPGAERLTRHFRAMPGKLFVKFKK